MDLIFREINSKDYAEVYAFNLRHEYSWRDSSNSYVPDSEEERRKNVLGIIERLKGGEAKYHCLAVFDGDEMIAAHFLDRYKIDGNLACHIHGLWVHANYRKMGIAKKLKLAGEQWATKVGCSFMDTNVRVTNHEMIALNEKLGYEPARINFRKNLVHETYGNFIEATRAGELCRLLQARLRR